MSPAGTVEHIDFLHQLNPNHLGLSILSSWSVSESLCCHHLHSRGSHYILPSSLALSPIFYPAAFYRNRTHHITAVFKTTLQWLPTIFKIISQFLTMTYETLHSLDSVSLLSFTYATHVQVEAFMLLSMSTLLLISFAWIIVFFPTAHILSTWFLLSFRICCMLLYLPVLLVHDLYAIMF